jgi:mono/diheme cytochrome c family protein
MSKAWAIAIGTVVLLLALVPPGLIALSRSRPSPVPPLHPILDMVRQPRFNPQAVNAMFADGRAMRPLVPGAEARQDLLLPIEVLNDPSLPRFVDGRAAPLAPADAAQYERLTQGTQRKPDGTREFVTRVPMPVSMDLVRRGRERFNIYCAPCHGAGGYGDGMVARRAAEMQAAGADTAAAWTAPTNYHSKDLRARAVGNLFNTITNGIRTMPAYDKQISIFDRWAIVVYVKALQRSQDAKPEDVPEVERGQFDHESPDAAGPQANAK